MFDRASGGRCLEQRSESSLETAGGKGLDFEASVPGRAGSRDCLVGVEGEVVSPWDGRYSCRCRCRIFGTKVRRLFSGEG